LCGVLGLGLASLGTVGDLFRRVADVYVAAPAVDSVTEFTSRFDGLRQMLPSKGNIGYMTDPDTPAEDANALAEFHLAQYALAPVIVVPAGFDGELEGPRACAGQGVWEGYRAV
jgi:hypothetical protein